MVTGAEEGEQRTRGRSHATCEKHCGLGALERRDPALHQLGVWRVSVSGVPKTLRGSDFLNEVDRLKERMHDRDIRIARFRAGMHRERSEVLKSRRTRSSCFHV